MEDKNQYQVLLYYKYVTIENPKSLRNLHHNFCKKNNLLGRILISKEGINGTISGTLEACQAYENFALSDNRLKKMLFKRSSHTKHAFPRLDVKIRPEIVNSDLSSIDCTKQRAKAISPEDFKKTIKDENTILVDTRNNYEYILGHFESSIHLDIQCFRHLHRKLKKFLMPYKKKNIIFFCTGGVRCEKITIYASKMGFNVAQLDTGILGYAKTTGGEGFVGSCYIFDNRISVPVNKVNPTIIGTCIFCQKKSERIVHCISASCNLQNIICSECNFIQKNACSPACQKALQRRSF